MPLILLIIVSFALNNNFENLEKLMNNEPPSWEVHEPIKFSYKTY